MSNELQSKYGFGETGADQATALAQAQSHKAIQEIQAALTVAMKNPRNESVAFARIMKACQRPHLAEHAVYTYPRGNQNVTGASIRLAEVLAQNWGNLSTGVRILSQTSTMSEVEAFAWDLETNYQCTKIFHVEHVRDTKQGRKKLTDARDIYEMVANQAARRQRACILAVIPGDIVDAALEQCMKTLSTGEEPIADRVRKLVQAFDEMGVNVGMLEKRLGHILDVITEPEIVILRGIYKSIKDGMADRAQYFDLPGSNSDDVDNEDLIKNKTKPDIKVNKADNVESVAVPSEISNAQ